VGANDRSRAASSELASTTAELTSDREIVITRIFRAPRAVVFDAWTRPERVAQWWDPSRRPLASCQIDLRPDGVFRFVPQGAEGEKYAFSGRYREIAPPDRLVFATMGSTVIAPSIGTIVFEEADGTTTLTLTIECASRADRDALLKMRVDVGTAQTLDNLAEHLSIG
jgi:uncharacterized protein YndB with AHSA1/START domain